MTIIHVHEFGACLLDLKDLSEVYEYFLPQEDAQMDMNYENQLKVIDCYISSPYLLLRINDCSVQMLTLTNMADFSVMVPDLKKERKIPIHEQRRRYEEYIKRRCCNMTMENYKKLSNVIKQIQKMLTMMILMTMTIRMGIIIISTTGINTIS